MPAPFRLSRLLVIWLAASIAVAIAGPFGTIDMPLSLRLPYWLGLIGINTLTWTLWFRFGTRLLGWSPAAQALLALGGIVIVNLPLPLEVALANRAVGASNGVPFWPVYGSSAGMGLAMMAAIYALKWLRRTETPADAERVVEAPPAAAETEMPTPAPDMAPEVPTGTLLARAGVTAPEQVLAVEAEDHYLRLHLSDGRRPLVLYRLRDALAELAPLDGEQVHRGYWVAGRAVRGLERRDGRKWALRLESGLLIPVSATFLPAVRKRGWRELDPALEP